ncbi:MAG TPA: hypothetical protein VGD58_16510 [Herpetosiphonaceae bacterium]
MIGRQHPRSSTIIELLVASARLYRNNFLPFILITALALVPYNLLTFVLADSTTPLSMEELISGVLRGVQRPNGGGWPGLIYNVFVQPIMYGTLVLTAAQCYRQQTVSIGSNFEAARGRWITLLGVAFQKWLFWLAVYLVGVVISFLVWLPLGILIPDDWYIRYLSSGVLTRIGDGLRMLVPACASVLLIVAAHIVLLEDRYASDSIARSWRLTKHSWWHTATFAGVVLLLQFGLPALMVGAAMAGLTGLGLHAQLVSALQMALVTLAQIVALPFSFIAHTLLFFDLRIRSQSFDPEQDDPFATGWNDDQYPSWLNA